jgi:hypothetical protein
VREESRKATEVCVFPLLCGSGGLEGQLTKVAGAEICGKSSAKSCINICRANPWDALAKKKTLFAPSHLPIQECKNWQPRATFVPKKLHAAVARMRLGSQNQKKLHAWASFQRPNCVSRGRCKDFCTVQTSRKNNAVHTIPNRWQACEI